MESAFSKSMHVSLVRHAHQVCQRLAAELVVSVSGCRAPLAMPGFGYRSFRENAWSKSVYVSEDVDYFRCSIEINTPITPVTVQDFGTFSGRKRLDRWQPGQVSWMVAWYYDSWYVEHPFFVRFAVDGLIRETSGAQVENNELAESPHLFGTHCRMCQHSAAEIVSCDPKLLHLALHAAHGRPAPIFPFLFAA